ncbi:MAG: TolC family outer membrane protein [Gammaproteobacteria bacterium]|nr:TolC family outer membrane protein [Gammaproteobacteria bacterium]
MNKFSFNVMTLTLLSLLSFSSSADDLITVYKLAQQNDTQFRAAQAEYKALLESKNQSIAGFLPTISANAYYNQNDDKTGTTLNDYKTDGYSLNLTQPIYRHTNYAALNQADAVVAQAHANFENARQDLIIRVVKQYFAVLAAFDDLEFAKAERKAIQQQLNQTQQRFNVGLIAITDVHEARALYDQAVARAIVAENTLAISQEVLREITNKNFTSLSSLSTDHPLVGPEPADINQWIKTANNQNALLMASQKGVDVARAEVSLQKGGHYPTLDLTASHSKTNYGADTPTYGQTEKTSNALSLQLNVPLYQGGLVNSKTRAAAYRLTQAQEILDQTRRATERQTRNSYLSVIANISQVNALKQALASSLVALEATQAGFEVGTRTTVDVLNSQQGLFRARRDYAQVRYNYVLETLSLKLAAGTLSIKDVEQLNPWLK